MAMASGSKVICVDETGSDYYNGSPCDQLSMDDQSESNYSLDVLKTRDFVKYTTPNFRFITVDLQHVVVNDRIETANNPHDVFLKHHPKENLSVPCSIKILDSSYISLGWSLHRTELCMFMIFYRYRYLIL